MSKNFALSDFRCHDCGGTVRPELIDALQKLRDMYARPMVVTSGYRCVVHNRRIKGAPHSAHLSGDAADIADPEGLLKLFCTDAVLELCGLWMEHPDDTGGRNGGWCHLQIRPVPGKRVFRK